MTPNQPIHTDATLRMTTDPGAGMDGLIGYILLGGVMISLALLIIGLALYWSTTGQLSIEYRIGGTNLFRFLLTQTRQAAAGDLRPSLLINWGIGVLMLTPYTRVLASVIYFAFIERNCKYTLFTGLVLCVLTYSLFLN